MADEIARFMRSIVDPPNLPEPDPAWVLFRRQLDPEGVETGIFILGTYDSQEMAQQVVDHNAEAAKNLPLGAARFDYLISETRHFAAVNPRERLLLEHLKWMANTMHQAYHREHRCGWRECPMSLCRSTRDTLQRFGLEDS